MAYFAGLELTRRRDGTTQLRGPVADQAALHGLLQRLGSLGLPILEVRRLDRAPERESDHPGPMSCETGATIRHDEISGGDRWQRRTRHHRVLAENEVEYERE